LPTTGDMNYDPAERATDIVLTKQAMDVLRDMEPRYRQVIVDVVMLRRNQTEVADDLGVSQPTVSKYINQGLAQLRDRLGLDDKE
jgi:DNA-directed RNA polymerase specialized sigma subunit